MAGIQIIGSSDIQNAIKKHGKIVETETKKHILKTAMDIHREAINNLDRQVKSKTLRQSIVIERHNTDWAAWIGSRSIIANFVEYGTKAHDINIRYKKVLADVVKDKVFGKHVKHPGTSPKPFMSRAAHKHLTPFHDRLAQILQGKF